jgi:hypothetical protein
MKSTRISNAMIPDKHITIKTVSWRYHDDTGIVLAMIPDVLPIPSDKTVGCT